MNHRAALALIVASFGIGRLTHASEPIITTKFTADPAPLVHKGVVYLYAGHDEDDAPPGMGRFLMKDWLLYSSTDMVNWTDHGTVADLHAFSWAGKGWGGGFDNGAWALQVIERDGKFYMYCPVQGRGIGVLVADSPFGPFKDPIGKPLIGNEFDSIDPTVFLDDDGQAYLYWGNPNLWYVKLNKDMISFEGEPIKDPSIAKVSGQPDPYHYQEGPWVYKRDGRYYLAYASTCCPEGLAYSMSDSPFGPWQFKGYLMKPDIRSSGNHPGIIDYKGKAYLFGFNFRLNFLQTREHHERRSICLAEMKYNPDGTIQELPWWQEAEAASQIEPLNPFNRVEGETIAWSEGMKSTPAGESGMAVHPTRDGACLKVAGVDFGTAGASSFSASVCLGTRPGVLHGGSMELRLDHRDGSLIGTLPVPYTAGQWQTVTTALSGASGKHDLFLIFKGEVTDKLFQLDYWQCARKTPAPELSAIQALPESYKIDVSPGDAHQTTLKVTAIYSDGTRRDVTAKAGITSRKPEIASVAKGIVTAVSPGEVPLDLSYEGKTCSLSVMVEDLKAELTPGKLTLEPSNVKLIVGDQQLIQARAEYFDGRMEDVTTRVTYTHPDMKVATIENGVLTGTGPGTTSVTAQFKGGMGNPVSASIQAEVHYRDPFVQNRATEFSAQQGLIVERCSEGGENLCDANEGEWFRANGLDFGTGAQGLELRVASATQGGKLEIHLDKLDGPLAGICGISNTGGWQNWVTKTCPIQGTNGRHDVFFKFTGSTGILFNINGWKFTR